MANATFAANETISGSTEEAVLTATIPEGSVFDLERVDVETVADPSGNVTVQVFYGDAQIAPEDDVATMANDDLTLFASKRFEGTDDLRVLVTKETTGSIDVSVFAHGDLTK